MSPIETQSEVIGELSFPHITFPSETPPIIPVLTSKAVYIEARVEPIELAFNSYRLPVTSIVLIFEEVEITPISNVLSIPEITNLSALLSSYILILSIVDVSSNTKVNVLGGGLRITLSEVVFSIFPTSNVEMSPDVFTVPISRVSLICSIDNDGVVVSSGGKN